MAFVNLPIPEGFDPKRSFIKWHGELWVLPDGGNSSVKHFLPPSGDNVSVVIKPTPKGVVRILCYLIYKLVTSLSTPAGDLPTVREEDAYQFGCDWPYSFSGRQLSFGPYQRFTQPKSDKTRILQGSCEDPQSSKFGDPKTYVYTVLRLNFAAIPGETSPVTWQLPYVGGPSYTPPGVPGTPAADPTLGGYYIELMVPAPMTVTGILDPALPLQRTLTYLHENGTVLPKDELTKLFDWIQQIKDSNLLPVIQNKYLPIHMQSHASKTGDPTSNMMLSLDRANKLKPILDGTFGTFQLIPDPRGDKNARPLAGIKPKDYDTALRDDRNVTLYINEAEAKAALVRDQKVVTP